MSSSRLQYPFRVVTAQAARLFRSGARTTDTGHRHVDGDSSGNCRFKLTRGLKMALGALVMTGAVLSGASQTQSVIANGDTRTLSLYYAHTKETIQVTFKRSGSYDRAALKQLNWFLRDWRREEPTNMDPRLFDLVWEVYRELGSRETIQVLSAFRAPATNAMLRRRSGRVAEHSQHMLGKAMDFYLPDVPSARVRAVGVRLQRGGVGFYPSSYNPFVHLDVGSVRAWPRLSHDQLAQIFPDGKTVHVPANGRPMARYNEARAEIMARGGIVAGATAYAADASGPKKGFWSRLFGGNDEGEDVAEQRAIAVAPAYKPRTAKEAAATAQQVAWSKGDETSGDAGLLGFLGGGRRPAPVEQPVAVASAPEPTADRMPPMEAQPARIAEMAPVPATRTQDPASLAAMRSDDTETADPAEKPLGIVPLPPRRPDDPELNMATAALSGEAVASNTITAAMAPLPPVRPQGLGISAAVVAAAQADDTPETPSTGSASLASAMLAPLPPMRPADLRRTSPEPIGVAAITGGRRAAAVPVDALAYASPETTSALSQLPPQRPLELRGSAVAPRSFRPMPGAASAPPARSQGARPAPEPETASAPDTSDAADAPAPVKQPAARPKTAAGKAARGAGLPSRIANAYDDAKFSNDSSDDDDGAALAKSLMARKKPAN